MSPFWNNLLQNIKQNSYLLLSLFILGLISLYGCSAKTAQWGNKITFSRSSIPTQCAGWQKLEIKNSTRYYLLEKDQRLIIDLDAHNLRGRQIGCWN